jgi:tellurite resistance-related uncharacterized protein
MPSTLIVAFAPGARGFTLGKWLLNNKIACACMNSGSEFNEVNHTFVPWYNDVLFHFNSETRDTYLKINELLLDTNLESSELMELIGTSKHIPFKTQTIPALVLTHHATPQGLIKLKKALNGTVIRITFSDEEQASQSMHRKMKLDNDYLVAMQLDNVTTFYESIYQSEYIPFLEDFDFAINVKLDQVNLFDLNFLKDNISQQ